MLLVLLSLLFQPPQERPTFTSGADLCVLQVSVVDKRAGFVGGLPREAFTVLEDGRPQAIAMFATDDTPVTIGLVVDSSGSMVRRRDAVITAGMAFAQSSHPDDEIFTINFNEGIWYGLPAGQAFTSNHAHLHAALQRSGARGTTALFDAIAEGMTHLDKGSKSRKVLVVVSDGGDNASSRTFQQVLDAALRRNVVIYTVGIYDPDAKDAKPEILRELSAATGGESIFPRTMADIRPALERIANDIRSSYTVAYLPPAERAPGQMRRIRVDVRPADGRNLRVRTRSAYVSGGSRNPESLIPDPVSDDPRIPGSTAGAASRTEKK